MMIAYSGLHILKRENGRLVYGCFTISFPASIQNVEANDATSTRIQSDKLREAVLISVCKNGTFITKRSMAMAVRPHITMTLLENKPRLMSGCVSDLVLKARNMCVSIHAAKAAV